MLEHTIDETKLLVFDPIIALTRFFLFLFISRKLYENKWLFLLYLGTDGPKKIDSWSNK